MRLLESRRVLDSQRRADHPHVRPGLEKKEPGYFCGSVSMTISQDGSARLSDSTLATVTAVSP